MPARRMPAAHTASDAGEEKVEVPAAHASGAVKREL